MKTRTDNQLLKQAFAADGFVALPNFLSGEALAELIENVERFVSDVVPSLADHHVFYENKDDPATLKQVQQMGDHDEWFGNLFTSGRFRAVAELLLDGPVAPKNLQYFNKPPGIGRPTPPHQDGFYFMLDPCEAVTMWFALDVADKENGCVRYVKGSHRRGMREHTRTETLGFSQGITEFPADLDRVNEVAMVAQPGDLLVHDALTIHHADANRSGSRPRRALGFIYYSERAREDIEAHDRYQRTLTADLKTAGKI